MKVELYDRGRLRLAMHRVFWSGVFSGIALTLLIFVAVLSFDLMWRVYSL